MLIYGIFCVSLPFVYIFYQYVTDTLSPLVFYFSFDFLSTLFIQLSFTFTAIYFFRDAKEGILKILQDIIKSVITVSSLTTILTLNSSNYVTTLRSVDVNNYFVNIFFVTLAAVHLIYGFYLITHARLPFTIPRSNFFPEEDWQNSVVVTGRLVVITSILLFVPALKMMSGTHIQYTLLFIYILLCPYLLITFDLLLKNNKFVLFTSNVYDEDETEVGNTPIYETKGEHFNHINKGIRKLHGEERWFKG